MAALVLIHAKFHVRSFLVQFNYCKGKVHKVNFFDILMFLNKRGFIQNHVLMKQKMSLNAKVDFL